MDSDLSRSQDCCPMTDSVDGFHTPDRLFFEGPNDNNTPDGEQMNISGEFVHPATEQIHQRVWILLFPDIDQSVDKSTTVPNKAVLQGNITVERGPGFWNCDPVLIGEPRMVGGNSGNNQDTQASIWNEMMRAWIPNWLATRVCQAVPYAKRGLHWMEHLSATILAHFLNRLVYLNNCPDTTGAYAVYSRDMRFGVEEFDLDVCAMLTPDQYQDSGYQWVVVQIHGAAFHLNAAKPRKALKDAMLRHICAAHEILLIEIYTPNIPVAAYPSYIAARLHDASPNLLLASVAGLENLPLHIPWGNCGFTVTPGPGFE